MVPGEDRPEDGWYDVPSDGGGFGTAVGGENGTQVYGCWKKEESCPSFRR